MRAMVSLKKGVSEQWSFNFYQYGILLSLTAFSWSSCDSMRRNSILPSRISCLIAIVGLSPAFLIVFFTFLSYTVHNLISSFIILSMSSIFLSSYGSMKLLSSDFLSALFVEMFSSPSFAILTYFGFFLRVGNARPNPETLSERARALLIPNSDLLPKRGDFESPSNSKLSGFLFS